MKFASILHEGSVVGTVAVGDDRLALLSDVGPWSSVRSVVEQGPAALVAIAEAIDRADAPTISANTVRWAAPIPDPSKMLFVALNNSALDPMLLYRPDFPVYFPKFPSTLAGNGVPIELHAHYGLTHPEPELGVIIGKSARHVSINNAMDHVFGYTVVNDVTSAGMRMEDKYFGRYPMPVGDGTYRSVDEHLLYPGRYKNADGFAPMGPFIVTADEIADPHDLTIKAWIDDEPIADDNTRNLHYSIGEVIHWMSLHSTLLPGDIIALGTALHPDAKARPLARGDINSGGSEMRVEIKGLGTLKTPIHRVRGDDPRTYFTANKRFMKSLVE